MLASRIGIVVVLALIILTGTTAAQSPVAGRAIFSYQVFEDPEVTSRGLHQIYDLSYDRSVTEPLHLRLSFRGEGSDGTQDLSGIEQKSSFWKLQPGAELDYYLPKLNLQARYDLYDTKSSVDDLSGHRKVEWARTNLAWFPDAAPSLSVQAEQRTDRDVSFGLDQKELRGLEALTYTWRGLTLTQTTQYSDLTLNGSGSDRKTLNLQGQLRYDSTRSDGRLSVSGYVLGGATRQDEAGGATSASLPTQVPITAALYARDDTPLDSRDNPPIPEPKLMDGDLTTRTTINVGPTGLLYQNLVADMGRVAGLDTLRIYVRDSGGNLVPTAGLLRWDVFTSTNALDWAPLASGAQTNFIFALSAYEVTFPKTPSRYFKVVSFGTNSSEAFVTELQTFFHTELSQGQLRRTDQRFVSGNLNVAVQAMRWLTLRYYGLYDNYTTTQPDRPDFNSGDIDHLVSADFAAGKPLNGTVRYERRSFTAEGNPEQREDVWFGVVQYAANRNLFTSLEATRTTDQGPTELTADTLRLHEYVRLFRAIEFAVDGGVTREDLPQSSLSSRQLFANGAAYVQLARSLRLTIFANVDKTRFTGAGAAALPDAEPTNGRYYGEIFYRPSGQLLLSARLGYVTGSIVTATTRTLRAEWYPFARGTIGFGTIYDEDVETNGTYQRFRRIQILPRWQVNRHVIVDVNYTYLTLLNEGIGITAPTSESKTKQLYVNLTWVL